MANRLLPLLPKRSECSSAVECAQYGVRRELAVARKLQLVVAGGTGVDSLLTIHVLTQRAKWGILPFGESDRLSIVVSVEDDRVGCPGNFLISLH